MDASKQLPDFERMAQGFETAANEVRKFKNLPLFQQADTKLNAIHELQQSFKQQQASLTAIESSLQTLHTSVQGLHITVQGLQSNVPRLERGFTRLEERLSAGYNDLDRSSECNTTAKLDGSPALQPLVDRNNRPIPGFPATLGEFDQLSGE